MELMEFLYRVMEELVNAGVPIVFKGAMVLNLAIRDNNPSKITEINVDELYQIWKESGRALGNFEAYKSKFSELREAYDKMKGIKNKPDFTTVYSRVSDVIGRF